jgi:hypothetical protein
MKQRPPFSELLALSHTLTHMLVHPHNAYTAHPLPSNAQRHTHRGSEAQTPGLSKLLLPPPPLSSPPPLSNSPAGKAQGAYVPLSVT